MKPNFERFIKKKYLIIDSSIAISFAALFIIIGIFEHNLFLPNNGFGLFEHINIWIFVISNISVSAIIFLNYKHLKNNMKKEETLIFEQILQKKSKNKWIILLYNCMTLIGFCFFIGNSLQNAHIINPLPFSYWDSIDFLISYMLSRLYKLYLFAYYMPLTFIYTILLIISTSEQLRITDTELKEYPIKNYIQLNLLCKFGLNSLLAIVIPLLLFSSGIYLVHERVDVTTVSTIIITCFCVVFLLVLYILLINKFYVSVIKYKKEHISQIDSAISEIHQIILNTKKFETDSNISSLCLQRQDYLWQCKERIEKISEWPLILKAIITIITPLIPSLIKILVLVLKHFFQIGNI